MSFANPYVFLQTFKGAPLSCLLVLLFSPHPMGSTELAHFTGYSRKTILEALATLAGFGIVVKFGGYKAWTINPSLPQSALPEKLWNFCTNFGNYSPITTTTINTDINKEKEVVAVESLMPVCTESHALLRFAAVGEPMATALAQKPHITPYYIAAHFAKALADAVPTGLLIHRLKVEDPAPEINVKYHLLGCHCPTCDSLRFSPDHGYHHPDDFDPHDYLESFRPPTAY